MQGDVCGGAVWKVAREVNGASETRRHGILQERSDGSNSKKMAPHRFN